MHVDVNCVVPLVPTDTVAGDIVIDVNIGDGVTVIVDILLAIDPDTAVIFVVPVAMPVTNPDELTIALVVSVLVHVNMGHTIVELF